MGLYSHHFELHFPHSNGVKIMKKIFNNHPDDPVLGLLNYRTTPSMLGPSPSQVSMSRLLNTTLPMTANTLQPRLIDLNRYREKLRDRRHQCKKIYDNRHRVLQLPEMKSILTRKLIIWKSSEKERRTKKL